MYVDGAAKYDDVYTFNPSNKVWTLLTVTGTRPTGGGHYFSMTSVGSLIYIFGGESESIGRTKSFGMSDIDLLCS